MTRQIKKFDIVSLGDAQQIASFIIYRFRTVSMTMIPVDHRCEMHLTISAEEMLILESWLMSKQITIYPA
jgi:hypothetical protein